MAAPPPPPGALLADFRVSHPEFLVETPVAVLWRVTRPSGDLAVLKAYKGQGMRGDAAGFAYLRAAPHAHAAEVYALGPSAALIEWLEGPSLGDLARRGHLKAADKQLMDTAAGLLRGRQDGPAGQAGLVPLAERFDALRMFQPDLLPAGRLRDGMRQGQKLAAYLLETQVNCCALHGDLHHENVRSAARGFCAFDAKGLWGERTYELANAFRHPQGGDAVIHHPDAIRRRAEFWAAGLNVASGRLLAWAAAKCALSIAWRLAGPAASDPEEALLAALLMAWSSKETNHG